jgi:hypothetical protein
MRKIILVFLCLLSIAGFSQKKEKDQLSNDTIKFISDLNLYFIDNTGSRFEAENLLKDFISKWNNNYLTGYWKEAIIETSNMMASKRLKPQPFFMSYFNVIYNFIESKQPFENFQKYQTCLEKMMKSKISKNIQDYLTLGENAFKSNILYKSPSYIYYSYEPNYTFEYDSVPRVVFKDITLIGLNPRGDSIAVENTSGVYYPNTGHFYCKGGKISWTRCGLDAGVYATVRRFDIDCKAGNYSSDTATFVGKQFFDKPQIGKFSDRIITENGEITYPRFDSYSKRLVVKNIYPDVDYDGGFGMRGPKFVGSGTSASPAKIIFRRNGAKFLEVSARSFGMSKEKIVANPGHIKFILDKDSITHPGLSFIYQVEKRRVTMLRSDDGLQKAPFANNYHMLDMHFEQLTWDIDEPMVNFGFLPNNFQGEAFFESFNFFTKARYDNIRGNDAISLLPKMVEYADYIKDSSYTVVDLAKYIKYMAVDLRQILYKVAIFGLIDYNPETDIIKMKPRLRDYIANNKHKKDYDIITFHSVIPGQENAQLSLVNNSYDLKIRGVKQILLSDTQKVFVFPKNGEVLVKKNRNFEFSGMTASGKLEFHGKDFVFDYEKFKIKMNTIDSVRIFVVANEPDINGNYPFKRVKTVIENGNGELRIDGPRNKSGWGRAPTFPQFQSFKESYAYYDKRSTFKSVYNRESFYFKLDPFTIDSLDDFKNESLRFDGLFSSSGIFPNFRETLTLQKDYSLGFIRKTPEGGLSMYGGKANYDAEIRLSDKGLRGTGDLKFGPSVSHANDFLFFPDSTNAVAQTFDIKETDQPAEFPVSHGDTVYIHYKPYGGLLQAHSQKTPFISYKEKAKFTGRYDLTTKSLSGNGRVDFDKADLISGNILFIKRKFFADTADFHLKAADEVGFTFSTKNVNSTIDFDKREGLFVTNGEGSYVEFNKNQYIAFMDRFKWYMDNEEMEFGDDQKKLDENVENALDLDGPKFISTHPKQDSLFFFAPSAKYNTRKYIINCKNVPFINVADARIYPDNGEVTIYKNAVMDTLEKAKISANTVTKYHTIRNVTANIYGRRSYLAKGDYQYLDENDNAFNIKFDKIEPDTSFQTVATGKIAEKEKFKFNDYFSFAGNVRLEASNQYLFFDGGTQIVHGCKKIRKAYLKFNGEINPKDILIPIPKNAVDMNGKPVVNAIMYSLDTNAVYSGFLSLRGSRSDKEIVSADGFLTFEPEAKEYRISNKEKLVEQSLPGNYLSLNTENCAVKGEGKFELGAELGQVEVKTVGNATHFLNDSIDMNVMMTVNFFFESKCLKSMAKDLQIYANSAPATDFAAEFFTKGLAEFVGKEKADNLITELNLDGSIRRFPDELEKTFFFNKINMTYKPSKSGGNGYFISSGPIGVGNILKNEINREFEGIIKIEKTKNKRDKIFIYLQPDPNTWYYFEFQNGTMKAVSSNKEFNEIIKEMKPKGRKQNVEKGPSFQFTIGNEGAMKRFVEDNKKKEEEETKNNEDEN